MMRTSWLSISGALIAAAAVVTGEAAFAQTSPATTEKKGPPSATPQMIDEAIQRSEARAAKESQTGKPEQWGSEEPFTYNPAVKRFDGTKQ